jgi:hypothetical protein
VVLGFPDTKSPSHSSAANSTRNWLTAITRSRNGLVAQMPTASLRFSPHLCPALVALGPCIVWVLPMGEQEEERSLSSYRLPRVALLSAGVLLPFRMIRNASPNRLGERGSCGYGCDHSPTGENTKEVIDRVKQKIKEIEHVLPPGVHIVPFYPRSMFLAQPRIEAERQWLENP